MKFTFGPAAKSVRRLLPGLPIFAALAFLAPLSAAEPEKKKTSSDDGFKLENIGLFTGFYEYDEPLDNSDPKRGSHVSGMQRIRMNDYYHAQSEDVRESSNGYVGLWASVPLGSDKKKEAAEAQAKKPAFTPRRGLFQTLMADEDVALHPQIFQTPPTRSRNMRTVVVERSASDYVRKRPATPAKPSTASSSKTPAKPSTTATKTPAAGGFRGLFGGK